MTDEQAMSAPQMLLVWAISWHISFGLGYATLNRYDPARVAGTPDAAPYAQMVKGAAVEGRWQYRVLVPSVAKPFYWLVRDRARTWNAVYFGMLMANAIFTATTVCLLAWMGMRISGSAGVALLGGALYLLNFDVSSYHLAGMVDAGEAFAIMAVAWTLFVEKWWRLPLLGVMGALAKETFVPLAGAFALAWLVWRGRTKGFSLASVLGTFGMIVSGLATVTIFQSSVAGEMVWPWTVAAAYASGAPFWSGLVWCLADRNFWYVFLWLLPLGVLGLKRLPASWVQAAAAGALTALALAAYNQAGGGSAARAMFNVSGPMLSLAAAAWMLGSPAAAQRSSFSRRRQAAQTALQTAAEQEPGRFDVDR
jgi:hypothetical protein